MKRKSYLIGLFSCAAIFISFCYPLLGLGSVLITLFLLSSILVMAIDKEPISPLIILLIVFSLYFIPRGILIESGVYELFWGFNLVSTNGDWLIVLTLFVCFYTLGHQCVSTAKVPLNNANYSLSNLEIKYYYYVSFVFFLIALVSYIAYVQKIGGMQALILKYNVEHFFEVVEDGTLSLLKNLTIWLIFASMAIFLSTARFSEFSKKDWFISILILVIMLLITISFSRRGHLFIILIMLGSAYFFRIKRFSLMSLGIPCLIFGSLMYSMFVIRRLALGDTFFEGVIKGFDSGEFWVFDQLVNVIQNGQEAIGYDYGISHLKVFVFFLFPYAEYIPIDRQLITAAVGVDNWGIPATVIGYSYLFGGYLLLPFYSFSLGFIFRKIDVYLKNKLTINPVFFTLYLMFLVYVWYLFRNGDPMTAIYHLNRWAMIVLFVYLAKYIISKKYRGL